MYCKHSWPRPFFLVIPMYILQNPLWGNTVLRQSGNGGHCRRALSELYVLELGLQSSRVEAWQRISLPDSKVCSDKFLILLGTFPYMCQTSIIIAVVIYWYFPTYEMLVALSAHSLKICTDRHCAWCFSSSEKKLKWLLGQFIFISWAPDLSFIKKQEFGLFDV